MRMLGRGDGRRDRVDPAHIGRPLMDSKFQTRVILCAILSAARMVVDFMRGNYKSANDRIRWFEEMEELLGEEEV